MDDACRLTRASDSKPALKTATAVRVMMPFFPVLDACGGRRRAYSTCPRVGRVFFQLLAPFLVLAVTSRVYWLHV